jgi:hypothetical protein
MSLLPVSTLKKRVLSHWSTKSLLKPYFPFHSFSSILLANTRSANMPRKRQAEASTASPTSKRPQRASRRGASGASATDDTETALDALREVLNASANKAVFTIGGKIDNPSTGPGPLPIVIRWSPGNDSNDSNGRMVSLPVGEDAAWQRAFDQLVKECEPATFGRGKEDILDEEYRKAGKMDPGHFSTNFTPYEYGVVDMIVQALAYSADKSGTDYRGIRAQLYNLNVRTCTSLSSVLSPKGKRNSQGRQEDC